MKIVINKCYGGFSLSTNALQSYAHAKGLDLRADELLAGEMFYFWTDEDGHERSDRDIVRDDPTLVEVVESYYAQGLDPSGDHAKLHVIEIPDDVDWEIAEYDGMEWVAEKHRTWG